MRGTERKRCPIHSLAVPTYVGCFHTIRWTMGISPTIGHGVPTEEAFWQYWNRLRQILLALPAIPPGPSCALVDLRGHRTLMLSPSLYNALIDLMTSFLGVRKSQLACRKMAWRPSHLEKCPFAPGYIQPSGLWLTSCKSCPIWGWGCLEKITTFLQLIHRGGKNLEFASNESLIDTLAKQRTCLASLNGVSA